MEYATSIEQAAWREGLQQGLLEGIELGLALKFGNEGGQLLAEISQIGDVEILRAILGELQRVSTPTDLRLIYQPQHSVQVGLGTPTSK